MTRSRVSSVLDAHGGRRWHAGNGGRVMCGASQGG
ncbi:hypothetical protein E1A91_A10G217800v1 [Gossypium mustelinum]|uniref:Uncharacterized protein n=1 Tax=Gossypium mustelinum TaxID=34275 RepID=A0A5D2XPK8_GOSMU|nr:hypothetical protein E1A91_A10G217800v1 [Gossypium mustelinum]